MLTVSIREAADQARVNPETARRWAHAGMGYRVGKGWRICAFKLDRKLHGMPLDPIPDRELAALLKEAANALAGDPQKSDKPLAFIVGELAARVRGERIRATAESSEAGSNAAAN